jgi:hypothetical protein
MVKIDEREHTIEYLWVYKKRIETTCNGWVRPEIWLPEGVKPPGNLYQGHGLYNLDPKNFVKVKKIWRVA